MTTYDAELKEAADALTVGECEKALSIATPLAEKLVPGALALLGAMYQLGQGVEPNGIKAVELLTKAVELGDGASAHNLGTIYAMGMPGVPKDTQQSIHFYRKAKAMGAQFAPDEFYETPGI